MALVHLKETLLQLRVSKTPAVLMSIDFQGAFDSVWHPRVLAFFRERCVPANLYHMLRTFLQQRWVVFRSNAGEQVAYPSLGSPQGSPISPLLWNVVIHDLLCLPLPTGITIQAYADDTIVVIPAESRERLGEVGSTVLKNIVKWTVGARVTLSTEKTYCVLFSNGHRGMEKWRPCIRLNPTDKKLTYKDSLRILGVVFDTRLSFFKHAEYLKEKTELLVAKIGVLSGMQGGLLRPEQKGTLYKNVILPAIMYGSPVWWDAICPDCRLKSRVTSLQRAVLLNLLGGVQDHTNDGTSSAHESTAHRARIGKGMRSLSYSLLASQFVTDSWLSVRPDRLLPTLDIWQEHPAARCAFRFCRLTRDEARRMARLPGLHIYTDGSYTDRLAGAAFVVLGPSERIGAVGRYRVENATSAYCTEVIALIEALIYIKNKCSAATVRLYTDCLSLLQATSEYKTTDPRVRDVKALLKEVSARTKITLYHVPGHSGLFGNELADFLAARAARLGDARQAPITPRAVRSMLRREQLRRWESDWRENNADTDLFKWVPHVLDAPSWFPPNRTLVTLLTGHGRFHSYFHRFNLLAEPVCSCDATCEGTDHYLLVKLVGDTIPDLA
ncbi:hypothetical protein MRX96_020677 [Rhipicephalus microplus]